MRREVARLGAVARAVADADRQLREVGEDVELRQRELVDPVHAHRVAEGDEVEPAAAALAAGHRPVLAAELAHPRLLVAFDLGRERALADAGHVRLRDADDAVDALRPDPDARSPRSPRPGSRT